MMARLIKHQPGTPSNLLKYSEGQARDDHGRWSADEMTTKAKEHRDAVGPAIRASDSRRAAAHAEAAANYGRAAAHYRAGNRRAGDRYRQDAEIAATKSI